MKLKPPTDYNVPIKEILDGLLVKDWNPYRKHYPRLQFHDLVYLQQKSIEIYDRVHGRDLKKRFCYEERDILHAFQAVFEKVSKPVSILELGAWNGQLAKTVFELYREKVLKYHGLDICPIVITDGLCKHPLYHPVLQLAHIWELSLPAHDIFVSAHTLEHMDGDAVYRTLSHQTAKYIVLESPSSDNWNDYEGSHINTQSVDDYNKTIRGLGYQNIYRSDKGWTTAWEK